MSVRPMIDVSARMFSAALVCVSKEETRYYIGGVHVEAHPDKGALLVATDGHRMLVVHDADGICRKPAIIPANKILQRVVDRAVDEERLIVDASGVVEVVPGLYRGDRFSLIEGTYPDWALVLRPVLKGLRAKTRAFASYNPAYLGAFDKIAARLGTKRDDTRSIRLVTPSDGGPSLVLFPEHPEAFALLMPMRRGVGSGDALPAWMKPVMEKKLARAKAKPEPAPKPKPVPRKRRRST